MYGGLSLTQRAPRAPPVPQVFLYLDRTHVLGLSSSTAPVKSIFELGLALFRQHLAARPEVRTARRAAVSAPGRGGRPAM
jgi:hypothetical protein